MTPESVATSPIARTSLSLGVVLEQLIDSMSLKTQANTYFVGPFTGRVNFASQQGRALNLVWALCEDPDIALRPPRRVAIVGAGLAGLMAAAALKQQKFSPVVFERATRCCPFQAGTSIRYAHPSLNFWPKMVLDPGCEVPFLPWTAGIVSEIVASVDRQWRAAFSDVDIRYGSEVVRIDRAVEGEIRLELAGGLLSEPFDVLIFATGYGLEKIVPKAAIGSYWENSDLPPHGNAGNETFLVSGTGDGALIEVLRIAYRHFDNGRLTDRIARQLQAEGLARAVMQIESHAQRLSSTEACVHLANEYKRLNTPCPVAKEELRTTGGITLLARDGNAFTPNSAPIHKYMLAAAIQSKAVQIVTGTLVNKDGFGLWIHDSRGNPVRAVTETIVVARHGTNPSLERFLSPEELATLKKNQPVLAEYQYQAYWPQGYFGDPKPGCSKQELVDYMSVRLASAGYLAGDLSAYGFEIGLDHGGEPQFVVRVGVNIRKDLEDALPKVLFGRKVVIKHVDPFVATAREREPFDASSGRTPLRIGDRIGVRGKHSATSSGEISGFAVDRRGRTCAITAAHVVTSERGGATYARGSGRGSSMPLGMVSRSSNDYDVALVELEDGTDFVTEIDGCSLDAHAKVSSLLGQQVVRRVSGEERIGVVSGITANVAVQYGEKARWITEAFIVSDMDAIPFAKRGDSGSLVQAPGMKIGGIVIARSGTETLVVPLEAPLREFGVSFASISRRKSGRSISAYVPSYDAPDSRGRKGMVWGEVLKAFERYGSSFRSYLMGKVRSRADVDDLIQDALVEVFESGAKNQPLIEEHLFRAVRRIAKRGVARGWERGGRKLSRGAADPRELPRTSDVEAVMALQQAMEKLPRETQRLILLLGTRMTIQEIERATGMSRRELARRVLDARRAMRDSLLD